MPLTKLKVIFILAIVGAIFAGAVTARQLIAPATEPGIFSCVGLSIFGLSPCPYGLTLFLLLSVISGLMVWRQLSWHRWLQLVAAVGVGFSGWVVWRELCLPLIQGGPVFWESFSLARVPACAWGFIVFLVIFIITLTLRQPTKTN